LPGLALARRGLSETGPRGGGCAMRFSQAWIIARHDMGIFRHRWGIMGPLINAFSFWFVIGAGTLPTAIAAYGIVGEKVEKSLEPLLSTPTTDGEILLGKTLAALVPTILAIWAGSVLFQGLIDWASRGALGYLYYPNWEMSVILFLLAPLVCLYAIEFCVLVSARVTDVRSAQQFAGITFAPLIFVYVAGEIGFSLDTTNLLYISGIFVVLDLALFLVSRRTFHREEILTRWK